MDLSGNDTSKSLESKRNALLSAFEALNDNSSNPMNNELLLRDIQSDYTKAFCNDSKYKTEIQHIFKEHDIRNNCLQLKTNLSNIDFPDILKPYSIEIKKEELDLSLFVRKLLTDNNSKPPTSPPPNHQAHIRSLTSNSYNDHKEDHENKYDKEPKAKRSKTHDVFMTGNDPLLEEMKRLAATYNVQENVKAFHKQVNKVDHRKRHKMKFISPLLSNVDNSEESSSSQEKEDERLKNIDPKIIELIKSEIMDKSPSLDWSDIAGLEFAKTAIKEAVVWPMLRPDLFTGLRCPPKGILLFGPPGTGKTLIGKCVASQSKSTFFSISASSLTSKWVGEGEKMVRALFAIARVHQPSIIFIDEIDSLLSQRNESEHESSRRIKTEFLVQLDGARTDNTERLLIIGATNHPQQLDNAVRRRFVKRLYIPLPDFEGRMQLMKTLMGSESNSLSTLELEEIARLTDGYSGADIKTLCSDASLGPIRSLNFSQIETIGGSEVRPVTMDDFRQSLTRVRSSVSPDDLEQYTLWDSTYGSGF